MQKITLLEAVYKKAALNLRNYFSIIFLLAIFFATGALFLRNNNFQVSAFNNLNSKKTSLTLRESIKQQENQIRQKKSKNYPFLDEKLRNSLENFIIGKTKFDSSFHNKLPVIPNAKFEQILEFEKVSSEGSKLSLIIHENRLVAYEDGQTGGEMIRYDLAWDTSKNELISLDEYDSFGRKIDKNNPVKQLTPEEDKAQEQAFYNKYNDNQKLIPEGEVDYSATIPKDLESQKKFFKEKADRLLDSKVDVETQSNVVGPENPLSIKTQAATTWNRESAAKYARDNAYRDYPPGYSNYYSAFLGRGGDCANFVSQALIAGGLNKDYNYNDTHLKDWYFHWEGSSRKESATWINASKHADHMYVRENTSLWYKIYPNNAAYVLDVGDIIYMNNSSGVTHHVMMVTGAQWRADLGYWDALYSQHTYNAANKSFTKGYNDSPGEAFYGLKFYQSVW